MLRYLMLISIVLFLMGFSEDEKPRFTIEFIQNQKVVPIHNETVNLEKDMFRMKVTLHNLRGVYLSASRKKMYFNLKDTEQIPDFKFISSKVGAEYPFNKNQEISVHAEYLSFLCASKDEFDCNKLDLGARFQGDEIIGYKTVKYISLSLKDQKFSVKNYGKDLYLFFFATDEYEIGKMPVELGRMKVKLKWKKH